MGQDRHRHDARLLRVRCLLLFLVADRSGADIGAHRSLGRDASSVTSAVHRRFRDPPERLVLHLNRRVYVQSERLPARHQQR